MPNNVNSQTQQTELNKHNIANIKQYQTKFY